jgi:hypothetical protein
VRREGAFLPATDRAALILQLVPYLIGKGEVSLTEAADEFDVTPEQMRGMVEKRRAPPIGVRREGAFQPRDHLGAQVCGFDHPHLRPVRGTPAIGRSRASPRSPRGSARCSRSRRAPRRRCG